MHHDYLLATHDANFLGTEGLRILSANPKVIALQAFSYGQRPLDLDMQCRCSL